MYINDIIIKKIISERKKKRQGGGRKPKTIYMGDFWSGGAVPHLQKQDNG